MEAVILVHLKSGIRAALLIKEAIEAIEARGHKALIVDEKTSTKHYEHQADVVVRWSTFRPFPLNGAVEVNTSDSVIAAENKAYSRYIMQQSGVCVPETWFSISKARVPFIVRPEVHSLGRQFRVVRSESERSFHKYVPNLYCSAIFPKVREYRAHTWGDSVFSLWDKNILPDELLANQAQTRRKWTHIEDYSDPIIQKINNEAIKACKIFGLTTGGVDVMVDDSGNLAICEINTMPMIKSKFLADLYAQQIIKTGENG